jgi:hypothetical protein
VGKVGLNLPSLDAVINAEGYKARVGTIQKLRSLTASAGKHEGMVIDFIDCGKYLFDHSEERLQRYQTMRGVEIRRRVVPFSFSSEATHEAQECEEGAEQQPRACLCDAGPSGTSHLGGAR